MPLPDANDYSMRIYELLKETDLENLSYAQFQGVAEKLFIEPENEDEMRRLVLVQLARMAVRGDWNGFLTGGGGGSGAPTDAEYVVMALNGTLTNERKLTAGSGISILDGGAGGDVTIASTVTSPVTSLVAGTNVTLSPVSGLGDVTINAASAPAPPVTSLIAGSNITLSPASGLGDVTITAATPTGLAPNDASYLTLGLDGDLTNERVLTAGTGIGFTDTGPNGTLTIEATGGGGGNNYDVTLPSASINTGSNGTILHSRLPPWGSATSSANSLNSSTSPKFWPFVCAKSGNLNKMAIDVSIDGTGVLGLAIYSDTGTCLPDSKIGGDFSLSFGSGTGVQYLTPSSTVALTKGVQYWIGVVETTNGNGAIRSESGSVGFSFGTISDTATSYASTSQSTVRCLELSSSIETLPATVNAANLTGNSSFGMPRWGAQIS